MSKTEQYQEVRVKLDISVTVKTCHTAKDVDQMIIRACQGFMPNNPGQIHSIDVAHEAEIYGGEGIKWRRLMGGKEQAKDA